ncbi:MAG TPA: prephenate dehydrogenase/arogenate dehydrogenase family protein [Symbiobacteriaceae bacterium]|nr:prephenate dehydrogenase/arogenate dehydrogenase family protein [Symbiobacteriaceae bacterium]
MSASKPTVAIWGAGLIGGSLGMAWRRAGVTGRIIGVDPAPLDEALRRGAIDVAAADPAEAIAAADVIVLAAPVGAIIAQASSHARWVRPGAVVTDVGSTKTEIVRAWEAALPAGAAFVGGHPLFGREVGGVVNASPDLPKGCTWVLTPGARSTAASLNTVRDLAAAAGANVRLMPPEEHDRRVAVASHLPQVAATALAAAALAADRRLGGVLSLAASGFRDTTRLASSPVEIWQDILLTNREAVLEALGDYRRSLDAFEAALRQSDPAAIAEAFSLAHDARRRLQARTE